VTANYGNFREYFESNKIENKDFQLVYRSWVSKSNSQTPDIIFISTNQDPSIILRYARDILEYRHLIISPGLKNSYATDNCFVYNKKVYSEVVDLFKIGNPIGVVIMTNISVPTSIYMFASFGIPIIGFDYEPINHLINENKIGELFSDIIGYRRAIQKIKNNYTEYQRNVTSFIEKSTWLDSSKIHQQVFR